MQVHQFETMGITGQYIMPYDNSNLMLYAQKRHISKKTWNKWLWSELLKAKFTVDKVKELSNEYNFDQYYYNKQFYRPVWSIVQEMVGYTV